MKKGIASGRIISIKVENERVKKELKLLDGKTDRVNFAERMGKS